MGNTQTITTNNAKETQEVGERLASDVIKKSLPRICCLYGELGAGKTVFAQGFAKGLGLPSRLVSPTFIIMKRYSIPGKTDFFYHIDLYRLQEEAQIAKLGLEEIFQDPFAITVIEWADRLGVHLPKLRVDIHFKITNDGERVITYA